MSHLRGLDKLMQSYGIKAVFIKEKQNCLRIVESENSCLYQIGYVVIGVNGHCFMTMTKAEQVKILTNEDIVSVETMPFDAWVDMKVEMQKEKKRAKLRVENMTMEQILKQREKV